jgi:hypothetical protein
MQLASLLHRFNVSFTKMLITFEMLKSILILIWQNCFAFSVFPRIFSIDHLPACAAEIVAAEKMLCAFNG